MNRLSFRALAAFPVMAALALALPVAARQAGAPPPQNNLQAVEQAPVVKALPFGVVGQPSAHPAYVAHFQGALQRYLTQSGVHLAETAAAKPQWILTGTMQHLDGPDTPFIAHISLCQLVSGKPGAIIACWTGACDSIFLFEDRMKDAAVHPKGLAGELGDRIKAALARVEAQRRVETALARIEAQRRLGAQPGRLPSGGLKVTLEMADRQKETEPNRWILHSGVGVTVLPSAALRLRIDNPGAKSVIVLGKDPSGRWYPLFVPERDEGVFEDGTLDLALNMKGVLSNTDTMTVWVAVSDLAIAEEGTETARTQTPFPSKSFVTLSSRVQVISGLPLRAADALWTSHPFLRALTTHAAAPGVQVMRFSLRKAAVAAAP